MSDIKYRYYKFDCGRFFRLDEENYNFQILKEDNLWEDDDALISLFYDAASNYYEIKDKDLISRLEKYNVKEQGDKKI